MPECENCNFLKGDLCELYDVPAPLFGNYYNW